MKRILLALGLVGAAMLSGCNGPSPFRDVVTFRYKFAEQQQPDRYHVQVLRGLTDPANCANQIEDIMRLDQVALVVQQGGLDSLINVCHDQFSVDVASARAVDNDLAKFEFYALANTSNRRGQLIASLALPGSTFPQPSKIQIEINSAVIVGLKATDGFAEINFGAAGPIYRCEGRAGEIFWDEHISDPATDTFLEFTLNFYDQSTRRMAAEFQCLARNTTDPSDNRLLLVMTGTAIMPTEN